ncbi:MAG: glycosyltransferase [Chloroflexi bacterium]|nr:glycosyltransferase [Chloroflexota bacterium]
MTSSAQEPPPAALLELSIIVPAYDEEHRIGPTLEEYAAHFTPIYGDGFEIVVVLNGCRDGTRGVVEAVARDAPQVRLIEFARPLGKGGAIWEGFATARGSRLAFVDADNMVRAPETEKLVRALETHDVAIADRFSAPGVEADQPLTRKLIGRLSRLWVRWFLGLPYSDTQCGAKAFRAEAWRAVAPSILERGWAFDLDVLAHVHRLGLSVAEVQVRWHHVTEGSKLRPWRDLPQTYAATFGIRRRAGRRARR